MNPHRKIVALFLGLLVAIALGATVSVSAEQPTGAAAPAAVPVHEIFARLADPAVAEKLKLTDEQRVKIATLQTERTEALAKAAEADRAKIVQEFEQKLAALLTDPQRAELAAAQTEAKAELKLRFSFRFQRWSDVLEWLAQQSNLSLVLDAPPPGTFNYSDNREYTLPEALDLLNGVLVTKGYTLIRRERMLVVVNLADGIPETLVPRIELADLDKRGKFEIVSMLFPVGDRNVDEVVKEISPLLGTRGKSQPLPQTKQILVTDTAGVMRAIHAVIESMPKSDTSSRPATPETPLLVVYPLKSADPDAAVKVLQALMPEGRFVRDPKVNQLSALVTPTQQAAVKGVLEQMQSGERSPEQQARLEVYDLDNTDPKQSLLTLQPLVPNARLTVDPTSKKLAVWGTPAEHEILKTAVTQLAPGGGAGDDRQIEVYRLTKADPTAVLALLQNVVPRARLSVDTATRSVVALASLADQKTIRATVEQVDPRAKDPNAPEVRFYPFEQTPPANLVTVLQSLAPKAQVTLDATARRLTVVATPSDHNLVKQTFEQFTKAAPTEEKRQLVLYPVTAAQRKRFQLVLQDLTTEFPTVKVLSDAEPGELAVWARPAEHKVIAEVIEKLKQQAPAEDSYRLVAYSIRTADPTSVLSVLQSMFPATKLVLDVKSRRLVAWTRPAEQESIKSLIEQMDSDVPDESRNQLMVYPVAGFDPSVAIVTMKSLAPDAVLTSDPKANTIVAWARKSDHALIAQALERIQPGKDPKLRPHVVAYPVGSTDPTTLSPLISALVPTARVVPQVKNGTIAVWATPDDHETIRSAIAEMTAQKPDSNAGRVVVYTLKSTTASNILAALQTAVPEARLGVGLNSRKLVAWARPADHETIRAALDELDQEEGEPSGAVLKGYLVTTADSASLLATLQSLFALRREVRFSLDPKSNKIVAMATPAQHETIRGVIEEIERGTPLDAKAQLEVHPLHNADPDVVMQVLNNLVTKRSRALLSVDARSRQLIAVAPEEQQATIRSTIERLQAAPRQLEVFQLEVVEPMTAELAINKLFADASTGSRTGGIPVVDSDTTAQRLYVRASKEQLEQIRDLLVKMGEANLAAARGPGAGTVRVIPFSGDSKEALAEIQRVWPQFSKSPLRVLDTSREPWRGLRPKSPAGGTPQDAPPAVPKKPETPPPKKDAESEGDANKQTRLDAAGRAFEFKTAAFEKVGDDAPPIDPAKKDQPAAPQAPATEQETKTPQPIIVAPGDEKITVMSDDPEAIAQFEALLRALSPPAGKGGRDIIVYPLHSASSSAIAELLNRLFRRSGLGSPVVVEADQRLNAVVVYGGRNDRATIERLLKVLDTDDVPESLMANRPTLIPVKNTSAVRISLVLKEIYKTQLTSGGEKQQIPIPSGASREVAAVIQQINTAAGGPLMTLGVDDATNSVVVMAPGPLVKEISDLVAELDQAALDDSSRGVKIVKLKSVNAQKVKEVLDTIIKDAVRRRSTSGTTRP